MFLTLSEESTAFKTHDIFMGTHIAASWELQNILRFIGQPNYHDVSSKVSLC
jgi:hypothetical protein